MSTSARGTGGIDERRGDLWDVVDYHAESRRCRQVRTGATNWTRCYGLHLGGHRPPIAASSGCRSDLWSLAVVAYRALTGVNPFAGQWLGMLMVRICADPFAAPSSVAPELSPEVDKFFDQA